MTTPVSIWLNRTYAENVFFIDQLRTAPRALEIHVSHVDPDSPVLAAADFASLEPRGLDPEAYVEYALDFCRRHSVQVFLPRLHQLAVARARPAFEAAGARLICPPATAIATFADKATGYRALAEAGLPVTPWRRVRTEDELLAAVEELEADGEQACLKPVAGAGGEGFRVLTREPFGLGQLAGHTRPTVQLDLALAALAAAPGEADLLVMPYLSSPEISVDCLGAPDGTPLAAVGRSKAGRRRSFTTAPEYLEPARALVAEFGLSHLNNVQFRHHHGRAVLLDVNTRPSGGLHQLRMCGLNLPWAAVQQALGEDPGPLAPRLPDGDYTLVSGIRPVLDRV